MSISIEALAMAGADYLDWGMDIEEWQHGDSTLPPHLLAEEEEEKEDGGGGGNNGVQRKRETICGFPVTFQLKDFQNRVESDGEEGNSEVVGLGIITEKKIYGVCLKGLRIKDGKLKKSPKNSSRVAMTKIGA